MKVSVKNIKRHKMPNKKLVRFIGDETCDRGSNDYFTLLLFEQMLLLDIDYEIIISNHGFEFITAYEHKKYNPDIKSHFTSSLSNLNTFISKGLVSKEKITDMIERVYKPFLKILSYSISQDEITLYTHAPVGLVEIKKLGKQLEIEFKDNSIEELKNTIDNINIKFQAKYVMYNKVHTLEKIVNNITWNRDYEKLERPQTHKGYKVVYVHGHDDNESSTDNICNLDAGNMLGKSKDHQEGDLQIFIHHNRHLRKH